jgi:hypothetical protein
MATAGETKPKSLETLAETTSNKHRAKNIETEEATRTLAHQLALSTAMELSLQQHTQPDQTNQPGWHHHILPTNPTDHQCTPNISLPNQPE